MDDTSTNNQPAGSTPTMPTAPTIDTQTTEQPKSTMSVKTEEVGFPPAGNTEPPVPVPGTVITPPMPDTSTATSPMSDTSIANPGPVVPDMSGTTTTMPPTGPAFEPPGSGKALKIIGLLALAVVVIGGMALGGYYLGTNSPMPSPTPVQTLEPVVSPTPTATPDPTADWESYQDSEYGFAFKYPEGWEVRDLLPSNKSLAAHKDDLVFFGIGRADVDEDVSGSVIVKDGDVTGDEVKDIKNIPSGSPKEVKSESEITFAGYDATEIVVENTQARVTSRSIVFYDGAYTYIVSGGGLEDNTVIDQIVGTFEFVEAVEETASPSPSSSPASTDQ